ncbi:DUF6896 domain-containing protein [Pseudomonas fragi]|uniref:DUF6896 domain-containing protein n=1 Tax=Pseudomonas fragi TaxID=296 RepID=UPI001F171F5D|nr:hypothetical protein [Pseudomonas fragi]MCF6759513.1 hypothetical protein [Pseudomonas fragi]
MDERLASLINDYLQAIRTALILMQKSGVSLPHTSAEWIDTNLSHLPSLNDDINYLKHGNGCSVDLPDGAVDFDFGRRGEISGLDAWRLGQFAKKRQETYGFSTDKELYECINDAINKSLIIPLDTAMYRLASQPVEYVLSIDSRNEGDQLPHREQDNVLTLQIHYFYATDLMLKNYDSLSSKWDKNQKLSRTDEVNFRIYMSSWLGFLAVTCEGYRKLNMYLLLNKERPADFQELVPRCNKLNSAINKHYDELRKFRNNVFHLRANTDDTLAFLALGEERISWAKSIHSDLKSFFSEYRILCECHYMFNGRRSEGEFGQKGK